MNEKNEHIDVKIDNDNEFATEETAAELSNNREPDEQGRGGAAFPRSGNSENGMNSHVERK